MVTSWATVLVPADTGSSGPRNEPLSKANWMPALAVPADSVTLTCR